MYRKISGLLVVALAISACGNSEKTKAPIVQSMQKKDKNLSCKEILLEMNEADFYRNMAHKNRGPKLKNVLMPLGYVSTYMNAEDAIEAADARVSYLDKIYEIMHCQAKEEQAESLPVYKDAPVSSNQAPVFKEPASAQMPVYKETPMTNNELPVYPDSTATKYEYSGLKFYMPN